MVISNWVERKLEDRRIKQEEALIARGREEGRTEGRKEGFEEGRAYERKMIDGESNDDDFDDLPSTDEQR